MNERESEPNPQNDQVEEDANSTTSGRDLVEDSVGGTIMFGLLYLLDRFRPSSRRRYQEQSREPAPPEEIDHARTGGTYETIATDYPAPPGVHEAPSSYWPLVVAAGIAFLFWGIGTRFAFSVFGVAIFVIGFIGWMRELLSE